MIYKLLLDPLTREDIIEIYEYVYFNDSPESAEQLLDNIEDAYFRLEQLPTRGHIPEELKNTGIKRFKEIHFKYFRIIYEIAEDIVYVHCILDGRRNIQEILSDRLLR
jgi:toxin ParE1/3/4